MAGVIPVAKGGTAALDASKRVLTGDIYVSRWQTVKGKGKKKRVVDHEFHANPASIGIGIGLAAIGAFFLGGTLWLTQRKLTTTTGKDKVYLLKIYRGTPGAAPTVTGGWNLSSMIGQAVQATATGTPDRMEVCTPRGVRLRTVNYAVGVNYASAALSNADIAAGYTFSSELNHGATANYDWYLIKYHTEAKSSIGTAQRTGLLE